MSRVGSIRKNQHEGGGGKPDDKLSKIEAAVENVESELLPVVRRVNDLELREEIGALTAEEVVLLGRLRKKEEQLRKKEEQLRKKEEQLRTEKLLILQQGQRSVPGQFCGC